MIRVALAPSLLKSVRALIETLSRESNTPDFFDHAKQATIDLSDHGSSTAANLHSLRKVLVNVCAASQKLDELEGMPGLSGDLTQEYMYMEHLISEALGPKAL